MSFILLHYYSSDPDPSNSSMVTVFFDYATFVYGLAVFGTETDECSEVRETRSLLGN